MCLPVELRAAEGAPAWVHYEWDAETELLSAQVSSSVAHTCSEAGPEHAPPHAVAPPNTTACPQSPTPVVTPIDDALASVEIEGRDGSWITLDLRERRINGVAIAVWPAIRKRFGLQPPAGSRHAHVILQPGQPGVQPEIHANVRAEVDLSLRTLHFSLSGTERDIHASERVRSVHIARDILIDVKGNRLLTGIWLLNVPPDFIPAP